MICNSGYKTELMIYGGASYFIIYYILNGLALEILNVQYRHFQDISRKHAQQSLL